MCNWMKRETTSNDHEDTKQSIQRIHGINFKLRLNRFGLTFNAAGGKVGSILS